MIEYATQNGVLSQEPPSPSQCYNDIKNVGEMFCTMTGQQGYMTFLWPDLVVMCSNAYLNLSIPFSVTGDKIVECPQELKEQFDEWKKQWSENKEYAKKALCGHTDGNF
uniref:Putative ixodes 10 kDa peptide protein n=1 Tax=Ixodes ricinus TaxID=34613 RepID=A0A0K8R6H3_IXORI